MDRVGRIVLLGVVATLSVVCLFSLFCPDRSSEQKDVSQNPFAEGDFCQNAEELEKLVPWIPIETCMWKQIVVDNGDFGPSDTLVCGVIKATDTYLQSLHQYTWYDISVNIPFDLEDWIDAQPHLMFSSDYEKAYSSNTTKISVYVDFESELIIFMGSL